jgi:hypothetical protein
MTTRSEELRKMAATATPEPWGVYDPLGDEVGVFGAALVGRLVAQAPTLAMDLADALEEIDRLREVIDSTANYLEEIGQGDGRACRWLRAALTSKEA